jgi:two-component system, OmpR family, sensor histidine kinase KdpD
MIKQQWQIQIVFSLVIVLAVAGGCFLLTETIGYRSVALILMLTVSILAIRMHLAAILTAAAASALLWDYFFIPPRFTFTIGNGEDALLLVMYFIIALLGGVIHYRMKQLDQMEQQKRDREHAIDLYNVLFNSLSHELRTPIATILGTADTLQEQTDRLTPSQKQELLKGITQSSLRLHEQVENLLNVSRIEAGVIRAKKEWCDVNDLIRGIVVKLKSVLGTRIVNIDIANDFPLVQLDYGLTEQILQNLLTNVARHTPADTAIHLHASLQKKRIGHFESDDDLNGALKSVSERQNSVLTIEFFDNGPGFPEFELDRVFEKFYRIDQSATGGTGLGLYVVRAFTEAQGGEVSLSNHPSGGARFLLEFPTPVLSQSFHHE